MKSKLSLVAGILIGASLFSASIAGAVSIFNVQQGGTGVGTFTSGLVSGNGTRPLYTSPTTTASCSGNTTCSTFTILGSSPITISSSGGGSTFPFIPTSYGNATSTTIGFTSGILVVGSSTLIGNATTTGTHFAGIASSTFLYGANLSPCTGTNALTWTGGQFTCTAQPQGTVTSLTVTTNQGVSGSFTAGATPALTINLGALTAVTSVNGLIITANTGVITTGTWNGTTIATANGGTNQTSYTANSLVYTDSAGTTFKSSGSATSTLSLSAGLSTTTGTLGTLVGGTSAIIGQIENRGFSYATTTAWTGTTTIQLGIGYGEKWQNAKCYTDVGTLDLDFQHASTHFNYIRGASTTVGSINMGNAADTVGDKVSVAIGTPATAPTIIACTIQDIN